jgi:hypothetical protein
VNVKTTSIFYSLTTILLRAGLLVLLIFSGWLVYSRLPQEPATENPAHVSDTTLQIILRPAPGINAGMLDISVELYPVDIVSVQHEYFTERRAGKRFDDFLSERMKGRTPVGARLDQQGQGSVVVNPGNWWLHAVLSGEEDLEWRLPIKVTGKRQVVELTSQNVYTRTRSF